jgi:hypothetical protein
MAPLFDSPGTSTLADLEAIPGGDGKRYELVRGHLLVSPWPAHFGGFSFRFGPHLAAAVPEGHASYRLCELDLGEEQRVIPDLMIAPHTSVGSARLGLPVLLIVEVLCGLGAPELDLKRAAYAAAEVPAYWLADPETATVECLRLVDGQYTPYAEGAVVEVDWPLPVKIDVPDLIRPQGA